jgi:UDP-2,3-diacylglucosamine pyrophosphatase LpxH
MKSIPTYLLGDHHSNYDDLIRALLRRGLRHCRIIHVGDGEEGYPDSWDSETAEQLDNAFASLEIEYLSIRGNHSNPHVFDGSVMLPNFKLLPDYTRLEIDGESWLFVGGAISINRLDRIPNETWWPEEEMVLREELSAKADVLVTHTGPTSSVPPVSNFLLEYIHAEEQFGCDTLYDELCNEATSHDRLFQIVRPRNWYHGHFHRSATHQLDGCTIRQLDVAELVRHTPD